MMKILGSFLIIVLFFTACKKDESTTTPVNTSTTAPASTTSTSTTSTASTTSTTSTTSTVVVTYSNDVSPIIAAKCNNSGCHGAGIGSTRGDFTTYTGLKAKVDNGSFVNRVLNQKSMPSGSSLSTSQLNTIQAWVNTGSKND